MRVLISNPNSDTITRYLMAWTESLIRSFQGMHQFFYLSGPKANRKHFCGLLQKKSIDVVIINGHGSDVEICGQNNEVLISPENVNLLCGKSIHALSCNTAKTLGPLAVQRGATSYIGYDERFILVTREGFLSRPQGDSAAKLFLDAAFTAPKALLNGQSTQEALRLTQDAYRRSMRSALNSGVQSDLESTVPYPYYDFLHPKAIKPPAAGT